MKRQTDRREVAVEALESRQMLSCVVGASSFIPGQISLLTGGNIRVYGYNADADFVVAPGSQLVLFNGQIVGPGTYTGATLNNLMALPPAAPVDVPVAPQITLTSDTSDLLRGQSVATVSASVAFADGSVPADGTFRFFTGRPSYDRNRSTGETRPCMDDAAMHETSLGNVTVVNGQAQLSVANLPVGENWVWAKYESADGLAKATSAPATITVRVPVGLHVEQGSIATLTNLPDIAVTLIDGSGNPLGNAGFVHPSAHGTIQQSTASVAFRIPLPPPLPVASTVLGGIWASSGTLMITTSGKSGASIYGTVATWDFGSGSIVTIGNYGSQWEHVAYHVPTPTGTVTFREGDQILGTTSISGSSTAWGLFRPQGLSLGHHTITVSYDGDNSFVAAGTETVEFDVTRTPVSVTLATSQAEVLQGRDFTLTATVATARPDSVAPDGTISIFCDNELLTTATLGGATTTLTTTLPAGVHQVRAVYAGGAVFEAGESPVIAQTVLPNTAPIGRVALDSSGKLTGWAVDMDATTKSLWCDVLVDGRYVRTLRAREFRADIAAKLNGSGAHGLTVNLPQLQAGKHVVQLMARDAQTGVSSEIGRVSVVTKRQVVPAPTAGPVSVSKWWFAKIQPTSSRLPRWWALLGSKATG